MQSFSFTEKKNSNNFSFISLFTMIAHPSFYLLPTFADYRFDTKSSYKFEN
ncbi:hypothetical protein RchiOBHm_Chr1g0320141 [Rosa chinensis]|uniref:Uncharacterized protein n=1 Tax=Rosa chinensis TaxID=74649 RepID=A0A2P6S8L2_ROSCH|nr:hypothetical protein RchiOBHm_Chr1g0320141 [Rosa chinensis]